VIPFVDGHTRQLPRLTAAPFRYAQHADGYLELAPRYAHVPVKLAVIAASAFSLLYPADDVDRLMSHHAYQLAQSSSAPSVMWKTR